MKSILLAVVLLALATGPGASARPNDGVTLNSMTCEPPARLASRWDSRDAWLSIDTEDRDATLLVGERQIAMQLSDRTLRRVRRELRDSQDESDNVLESAIKAAVFSTVRVMLDHSIEYPIREIRDVEYRHGRLAFTSEDGESLFEDIELNDRNMMGSFSERDARAFVREFRRAKERLR